MSALVADDFPAFFEEVYGHRPFPWQTRLAREVLAQGWPDLIDLPTGTGKTSALDVALFALAIDPSLPRRTVFVVDRRIVVHQAAARVRTLVGALRTPPEGSVAAAVAARLKNLAPAPPGAAPATAPIVNFSELRGGIVRDERWATRPDVPAVLVSTVDQVGSRLLFRGYGVSRGMRPIHAGLLGASTLYLLDEVHLARPFQKTLHAIGGYRDGADRAGAGTWKVVEMSATPTEGEAARRTFRIEPGDRTLDEGPGQSARRELLRRLDASKPAVLRDVRTVAKASAFTKALADAVEKELKVLAAAGAAVIGVVVNRVATAVEIDRRLAAGGSRSLLVTGRMRPIDREAIVADLEAVAGTNRVLPGGGGWEGRAAASQVGEGATPTIVVATQAIEAGADLDLDALVTECASVDALKQRFGRVDRTGAVSAAGTPFTSVVIGPSSTVGADDDPVYGAAISRTWDWLRRQAVDGLVDFGSDRLATPDPAELGAMIPPDRWTPELLPSHVDRLVQTSIEVDADPVPAHWLHGLEDRLEDVNVVWRADVTAELLAGREVGTDARDELLRELLEWCPPSGSEAMAVPPAAARAWLQSVAHPEAAEVSEAAPVTDATTPTADASFVVARRRSIAPVVVLGRTGQIDDDLGVVDRPALLAPGSTIVVPATYGGLSPGGSWDPTSTETVPDRATSARVRADGRVVLRLLDGAIDVEGPLPEPAETDDPVEAVKVDRDAVLTWLTPGDGDGPTSGDPLVEAALRHLRSRRARGLRVTPQRRSPERDDGAFLVVTALTPLKLDQSDGGEAPVDSEPDTSSFIGEAVGLEDHLSDVRAWATTLAVNLGLPDLVGNSVALAGWFHDLGKADPRFQRLLRDGELDDPEHLLAKSSTGPGRRRDRRRAEASSGYPRGARHELLSLTLVDAHPDALARDDIDPDLVRHLVVSHHGYCRPFAPVALDLSPIDVEVRLGEQVFSAPSDHGLAGAGSGVSDRFWRLHDRYGPWGLAWLEAVLRLADHRASAATLDRTNTEADHG